MWTDITRAQYARADLTLPSDLTDAERAVLEPFFPAPLKVSPAGTGDRMMRRAESICQH